jgi:hypothetical protein
VATVLEVVSGKWEVGSEAISNQQSAISNQQSAISNQLF